MKKKYLLLTVTSAFFMGIVGSGNVEAQINTFPYVQDFGSGTCVLPAGYSNSGSDPWDFRTSQTYMVPGDHTTGSGCFLSMDDSGGATDDSCLLTSPTLDMTTLPSAKLTFWWQNSSTTSPPAATGPRPWSNLYVDMSDDDGVTWTRNVLAIEGTQQIGWAYAEVVITQFTSATTKFRIRGLETQYFQSDLSVDDITVEYAPPPIPNDVGILSIDTPSASCAGMSNVVATIENYGTNQVVSAIIDWTVDGVPMTPVSFSGLLDTVNGTGPTSAQVTLGSVSFLAGTQVVVDAWTSLPNGVVDLNPDLDSASRSYDILPMESVIPYYQDFEQGQGDWAISGTNSSWAFGTPASANIVGAASGDTCFVTSLSGSYNANENSEVSSPCFDLSQISNEAWVGLDVNYYSENSWDGAVLQSSIDGGLTWENVGAFGDPYNWYNDNSLNGQPGGQQEGWTGTTQGSNGWKKAIHKLDESLKIKGTRFRVAFGSDGSVQYEGFAFDNFTIVDYIGADLGADKQSFCGANFVTLDPHVNFNGTIVWSDGDSISQTISVSKDTVHWVAYTDTMLGLTSRDTVTLIESPAPVINFESASVTIGLDEQVTLDPRTPYDIDYDWQPVGLKFPYLLVIGTDVGVGVHPYTLSVVDSVGCTDQKGITVTVKDFTGINENEEASISYFPNPVDDILTIQLKGFADSQLSFEIIDLQGKVMLKESVTHQNNRTHTMNLANLPSGMYMLSVKGDNKSSLSKIVVN